MREIVVLVEGDKSESRGKLRIAFGKLFNKKLEGKNPRFITCGGKNNAIDAYHSEKKRIKLLLIDLDCPEEKRHDDLNINGLADFSDDVFYMIMEMEAWFLSQSDILETYFKITLPTSIKNRKASEIEKPSDKLIEITKQSAKGEYHKVKHASELLPQLDIDQLMKDFPDVKRLIERIEELNQ